MFVCCRGKWKALVSYIFNSYLILDFLGFSLFYGALRTFSVYRPFFCFSAYFGLSRYIYSTNWSKYWSKMDYFFKFRPLAFSGLFPVFLESNFFKTCNQCPSYLYFGIFGKCYETFADHQWLIILIFYYFRSKSLWLLQNVFRPFLDHSLALYATFHPFTTLIFPFRNRQ